MASTASIPRSAWVLVAAVVAAAVPVRAAHATGAEASLARGLRSEPLVEPLGLRLSREPVLSGLQGARRVDAVWPLPGGRDELRAQMLVATPFGTDAARLAALPAGAAAWPGALWAAGAGWRGEPARLTWRHAWIDAPELKVRVGVTARSREPGAVGGQGPILGVRADTGFVPLLHASIEQRLGERFSLLADLDGRAVDGRAGLDAGLRLRYDFTDAFAGTVSYRLLEASAYAREPGASTRQQSLSLGLHYRW